MDSTLLIISDEIIQKSNENRPPFDKTNSIQEIINSSKSDYSTVVEAILDYFKIAKEVEANQRLSIIYGNKTPKIINSWQQQSLLFILKQFSVVNDSNEHFENFEELFNIHCSHLTELRIIYISYNDKDIESLNQLLSSKFSKLNFQMNKVILSSSKTNQEKNTNVKVEKLKEYMVELSKEHFSLITLKLNHLPLSNKTENILVQSTKIEITQDVLNQKLELNFVQLDDLKMDIESYYCTKSFHRVSLKSKEFLNYLSTHSPLCFYFESDYNKKHHLKVTHLLIQHQNEIYLHSLILSRVFLPWLTNTVPLIPKVTYRIKEFTDLNRDFLIYDEKIRDDETMFDRVTDTKENLTKMQHLDHIYYTPRLIERKTRLFPLCGDKESVLFNSNGTVTLKNFLAPLIDLIFQDTTKFKEDEEKAKEIIVKLYSAAENNDISLIPELSSNHTARFDIYNKVWSELHDFVEVQKQFILRDKMDTLWPHFFYDKKPDVEVKKNKRLVEVQRDLYGNVIFPINLGALTIHSVGKVIYDRPAYHTDKYIWPVGFKATRVYTSMKNVDERIVYTCEIKDGGFAPIFVLNCRDFDSPIEEKSATAAWTSVVKTVNEIKSEASGKKVFTNVSGPEYFGLANPTVMKLISELPNAEKCDRPNAVHQPKSWNLPKKNESLDDQKQSKNEFNEEDIDSIEEESITEKEKRNLKIEEKKMNISKQLKNLNWKQNLSFYEYIGIKRKLMNISVEFDGREEEKKI
eukprot:gene1827-969_t